MANPLVKRFILIGSSSVVALTGALLIDPWESNKNNAYIDMVGVATICRGETKGVKLGDYKTDEQCDKSTVEELNKFNAAVKKAVKVEMSPYEEIAYTSLAWNIGTSAFSNSSLVKKLNAGEHHEACKSILDWNRATFSARSAQVQIKNGEQCSVKKNGDFSCTVKGLTNRRNHEYKVCIGEDSKVNEAIKALEPTKTPSEAVKSVSEGVSKGEVKMIAPAVAEAFEDVVPNTPTCKWKIFNICLKSK